MTSRKVKRSEFKTFLNTGTVLSPVWSLLASGVPDLSMDYGVKTTVQTDIDQETASVSVDSYAPKASADVVIKQGDTAYDYIHGLMRNRAVMGDAETEIVNVYLYDVNALTYYVAEKQTVSISIEKFGGKGGEPMQSSYTLHAIGDPVRGTFSPADLEFVLDPVSAILDTLAIGALTLAPLFSTNHSWLWYAGTTTSSSVTMTSTSAGADSVTQYDGSHDEVDQGDSAALSMGVNHLTIVVVAGSETVTYHIDITRTA